MEGTQRNLEQKPKISTIDKEFRFETKIEKGQDGWLTPKGKFYPCPTTEHDMCAKFLTSEDTEDEEFRKSKEANSSIEYKNPPPRTKLEMAGFVLVRGNILPTQRLGNLEPEQLKVLGDAGIKITNPIDNEFCSVEFVQETIKDLQKKIRKIKKTEIYFKKLEYVKEAYSRNGMPLNTKLSRKKYQELVYRGGMYHREAFAFSTFLDIEDREVSPLTKGIVIYESILSGNRHEIMINTVFDTLSEGYREGLIIRNGRYANHFRIIPTEKKNIYIVLEKTEYHHDGSSGGITGDRNYYVSSRLTTGHTLREHVKGLIKKADGGEISLEGKTDVFGFPKKQ